MADIVLRQGQSLPANTRTRYRDMGDGTHALVVYDAATGGGGPLSSLQIGDVTAGNYAEFSTSGFLFFYGNARGWIDFNFGVGALNRGAAAPDLINLSATSIQVLGFDRAATLEQVSVDLELNHNWSEGTVLKPHVHWMPTTAAAGNVNWQLEYVLVADGATVGASTTLNTVVAAPGVAWQQVFTAFADIATTGLTIGTQAFFRLFRDPTDNDTYGADAAIATFGVHVLLNSIGSRQVGTK